MSDFVCVPISRSVYNEFILRTGKDTNVARWIEDIVEDFLERNAEGHPDWCDQYYENLERSQAVSAARRFGDPKKGYQWQNIYMPNGTQLKMTYKSQQFFAEVKHGQIWFLDEPCSPSEFAYRVANNTRRNAWRDIWLRFPGSKQWEFADKLRKVKAGEG